MDDPIYELNGIKVRAVPERYPAHHPAHHPCAPCVFNSEHGCPTNREEEAAMGTNCVAGRHHYVEVQ